MKALYRWLLWLCAVFAFTLLSTQHAAAVGCVPLLTPRITNQELADSLTQLDNWRRDGICGENIGIGVFVTGFPVLSEVASLLQEGQVDDGICQESNQRLVFNPDQCLDVTNNNFTDSNVSDVIAALHYTAPAATIYLYRVSQLVDMADDFESGVRWMTDNANHHVRIIINLVAEPRLLIADVQGLDALMTSTVVDEGILWLNAAGNFGNSYYTSTFEPNSGREGWHNFRGDESGLLPIRVVDTTASVIAYVKWSDERADLRLVPLIDDFPATYPPASQVDYERFDSPLYGVLLLTAPQPDHLYLALDNREFLTTSGVSFEIFLVNAVIDSRVGATGNSIPPPNNNAHTLTVGALDYQLEENFILISSRSGDKPEILTYGAFAEGQPYRSGFATALVAGIAATYWSENLASTEAEIQNLLNSDIQQTTLAILPRASGLNPLLVIAGVSVGLIVFGVGGLSYRNNEQNKAELAFNATPISAILTKDAKQLFVRIEPSFDRRGFPKIFSRYSTLVVTTVFRPDLLAAPEFGSPMLSMIGSKNTGVSFEGGVASGIVSIVAGYTRSGVNYPAIMNPHFQPHNTFEFKIERKSLLPNQDKTKNRALIWWFEDLQWDEATKPAAQDSTEHTTQLQVLRDALFEAVQILMPLLQTPDAQKTFVNSAFFGTPLPNQIEYGAAAQNFTHGLLVKLLDYGVVDSKPALLVLADYIVQNNVIGVEKQKDFSKYCQILTPNPTQRATTANNNWHQLPPPPSEVLLHVTISSNGKILFTRMFTAAVEKTV